MNHPPAKLWLQWNGDGDPEDTSPVDEECVTWAGDKIFASDVCYIRADVAASMGCGLIAKVTEQSIKEALEVADECLALIEDVGHGAHVENVTAARGVIERALILANKNTP